MLAEHAGLAAGVNYKVYTYFLKRAGEGSEKRRVEGGRREGGEGENKDAPSPSLHSQQPFGPDLNH